MLLVILAFNAMWACWPGGDVRVLVSPHGLRVHCFNHFSRGHEGCHVLAGPLLLGVALAGLLGGRSHLPGLPGGHGVLQGQDLRLPALGQLDQHAGVQEGAG